MKKRLQPDTELIHAGEGASRSATPVTTPIYSSSTFEFASAAELEAYQAGRSASYIYSRYANPTVQAVEAKLAAIEGGDAAIVLSSGMAATSTALFGLLRQGDEVICSSAIYGGTLQVLTQFLDHFGVRARFVSMEELMRLESVIGPQTRVVWFESPTNPTLRCVDIAVVSAACRAKGVVSIVDNTFASPVNQQPLALGADMVMHSATKYLNGHTDVTAGVLVGSNALIDRVMPARKLLGGVLEPASAYALGRGMKTLSVRIERHNANALAVARWLESQAQVALVFYPGLESHPDHAVASRQMKGFGGMVCFELRDGQEAAYAFFDKVRLFKRAASLGGTESLLSLPILTSQYGLSDTQLDEAGVTRGMVRLSVGLEDPGDLIDDLQQALTR
ncbi:MAG: aminotransferase class I/II-fold pyridoxal phosphate-dependent enzyme [Vicinamibacterales bacterium]